MSRRTAASLVTNTLLALGAAGCGDSPSVENAAIVNQAPWPMHEIDGRFLGANGIGAADLDGDGDDDGTFLATPEGEPWDAWVWLRAGEVTLAPGRHTMVVQCERAASRSTPSSSDGSRLPGTEGLGSGCRRWRIALPTTLADRQRAALRRCPPPARTTFWT